MHEILLLITQYRYIILFPLAAVEGPIVALLAGFLVSTHYLSFFPAYVIMLLGDLIPDTGYYYIGRFGNKKKIMEKYGHKSKILSFNYTLLERLWYNHGKKTMFFSKLAYGLSTPFLISAGLANITFKKFISYAIPTTLFQYTVIMLAGYLLGHSYLLVEAYIKNAELVVAAFFILFLVGYAIFFKYAKQQIINMEKKCKK